MMDPASFLTPEPAEQLMHVHEAWVHMWRATHLNAGVVATAPLAIETRRNRLRGRLGQVACTDAPQVGLWVSPPSHLPR
jgi:hypothetical protein